MSRFPHVVAALTRLAGELEDEAEGASPEVAVVLLRRVLVLRKQVAELQAPEPQLQRSTLSGTLRGDMEAEHRGNISKAHLDHPMMDAARKAGLRSLGDLAEALGYDANSGKSFLSRVLKGDKKLPSAKAEKFRELTGKSWKV